MILFAVIAIVAVLLLVAGFEMFLVLGVPALMVKGFFYGALPDTVIVQKVLGGINHSTLLAIPFFILAAELMGEGQIARRLMNLVKALVGHMRGGMGYTTIGGAMAFGSVSGSAPATVAATAKLIYPEMRAAGFRDKFILGLIVSSAETALLIPPSITFIIYGWMTGTSVASLFAGGLAVGVVLGLAFAVMTAIEARRQGIERGARTSWGEKLMAVRQAGWALGLPVIILGGIYSGYFTPTEAAAVGVVYAAVVEILVYRDLSIRQLFAITERAAVSTAVIFILLAMGGLLGYFITLAQVPTIISGFLAAIDAGPITFLIVVNICFLIAGMFIDPNSALLILVPPLFPVAVALGIDPIHFGMIVTLNICIGMITPPFGLDLFVASSTLQKPVMTIVAGVWPFVITNLVVLGIVTYVPDISTFLPRLVFG
ncbi:TRAP transporter large permease [Stappia taiwanensis]|uniref:TRAP transporter large permease protein n=1 Tax=Stappia taiwanensis TaxID=992267 RepID=A0A838XVV7_9HYPH|nr:TRAP transporter large permease [Stappia taiwanensis]MBA4613867.1 TRAP transporter large permease [Stappia taiwanensis]GGF07470.1 C4-dicarboxylate ABC transporter [Stappia taiwanensis]